MKSSITRAFFLSVCVCGTLVVGETRAQSSHELMLEEAESRLRAIYDRSEFRAKVFRANWLPDSSGYTVREPGDDGKEQVLVRYDVADGKRTVLDSTPKERSGRSGNVSPDGQHVLFSEQGNLYVRDVNNERKIRLTHTADDSSISNGQAVWSPDGTRIAFVQSDNSRVRLRSVLVPTDPSYPGVREVRFARVGEAITRLRVGVVDAQGKESRWLAVPTPAEGYYLGQVEWAGNSDELLIEKLSRFRNEREFLLADIRTGAIQRIFHESDPAWVIASYHKNSGLTWIRDGQAFLVLSEKDGWRHAYVYSRDGQELNLLTPGPFDIIERTLVDEAGGWFYYYASPDNATQSISTVCVWMERESPNESLRTTSPAPTTTTSLQMPSGRSIPTRRSTLHPSSNLWSCLNIGACACWKTTRNCARRWRQLISQPTEFFQLEIGDGVVMDAWMIKPRDFDASRKYPVLVYVYGEPHAQTVLDAWGKVHADYHRMIADLGYLVVSIDNRGTPAPKGAAWRRAIFGSLGPLSTKEQAAGVGTTQK
jgi:dipeptidyl-peptidase-4